MWQLADTCCSQIDKTLQPWYCIYKGSMFIKMKTPPSFSPIVGATTTGQCETGGGPHLLFCIAKLQQSPSQIENEFL